jgi:cysteine synthase A
VAIAPDLGERYLDTIYNPTWVADLCGDAVLTSPARTAGPRAA